MEREEQKLIQKIKTVYTKITKALVDPSFKFPEGGKVNITLKSFIVQFTELCGGQFNTSRLVDYCVFQIHKNRNSDYQRSLAPKTFGKTAFGKYCSMASKEKKFIEDKWLAEGDLTRASLNLLISTQNKHPQAKYIYMPSEEGTKKRWLNSEFGLIMCATSTLMWSPFSSTCQMCKHADMCKIETQQNYPELYRIRLEEYDKGQK